MGGHIRSGYTMRVLAQDREIDELTPSEFALLATLALSPGRVFTRAQLLDALHGVAFESYERAIDAHIKNIRHKIEPNASEPRYILTVYGVGYRFSDRSSMWTMTSDLSSASTSVESVRDAA